MLIAATRIEHQLVLSIRNVRDQTVNNPNALLLSVMLCAPGITTENFRIGLTILARGRVGGAPLPAPFHG